MGTLKKSGGWTEQLVLFCLIRELLFKSTALSRSHSFADYQRFDCRTHQLLSLNNLTSFNSMYVVTRGQFTCPVRSMFVFAHNQDIGEKELKQHPIVTYFREVKNAEELLKHMQTQKALIELPRHKTIIGKPYDLVEFDQNFYQEKFSSGVSRDQLESYKLRLCAFLDLKKCDR